MAKNKSNLRVFPVLKLISLEYPQYSISDTKGNVISHVKIYLSGAPKLDILKGFTTENGHIGP